MHTAAIQPSKSAAPPELAPAEFLFALRNPSLARGRGRCPVYGVEVEADADRLHVCEADGSAVSPAAAEKFAPNLHAIAQRVDPAEQIGRDGVTVAVIVSAKIIEGKEYKDGFTGERTTDAVDWFPLCPVALSADGSYLALSTTGYRILTPPSLAAALEEFYGSGPRKPARATGLPDAAADARRRARAYALAKVQLHALYHAPAGRRGAAIGERVKHLTDSAIVLGGDRPVAAPMYGVRG